MNQRESQEGNREKFYKLLQAIQNNPQLGLNQFYDVYGKLIQTTALAICRSSDKANEVVDDVLIKIWKLSGKIGEISNPAGWLYTITANTAKDSLRKNNPLPLEEEVIMRIAVKNDETQQMIAEDSFYSMIKDLGEMEQAVMIHKFVSQYTFQEIAEELNKPLTTISSLYYRALEKIKAKVESLQ